MQDRAEWPPEDPSASHRQLVPAGATPLAPTFPDRFQQPTQEPPPQGDVFADIKSLFRIALKRIWLILGIVGLVVALGAAWTLVQTPIYRTKVRIQIDSNDVKFVEGGDVQGSNDRDTTFFSTEIERLRSRAMAHRVVSSLKLANDESLLQPTGFSVVGAIMSLMQKEDSAAAITAASQAQRQSWATTIVRNGVYVKPVRGTRMLDIIVSDAQPARAQQIANAYAKAYIDSNVDKRFAAHSYAKTFLDDQIQELKHRLESSEKALIDFAQDRKLLAGNDRESTAETNLVAANNALSSLRIKRIEQEQQWRQIAGREAYNLPQLLANPTVETLLAKRGELQADYNLKRKKYKPGFPAMRAIQEQISQIDQRLNAQVTVIEKTLEEAYKATRAQEEKMEARVTELQKETLELQKRGIQYNILKREVDINRKLYTDLLQRRKAVGIAGGVGTNNVFVIESAGRPQVPSSPNLPKALLFCLALGLGAGLISAYLIERFDDRVTTVEDLERITGLVTLGIIPKLSSSKNTIDEELADPLSSLSESYQTLATALQFSTETGLPRTLMVTSATPGEGKTTTAVTLARHFATLGLNVLLIDADMRKPALHTRLGLDNEMGLADYLLGDRKPPEVIQDTDKAKLAFIASGPLPPHAASILDRKKLRSLLSSGLQVFDLIIIDAPPVVGLSDSLILSSATDATVFVAAAHQVRASAIGNALRALRLANGRIVGSILTKADKFSYDYNYHAYGYGYRYGATTSDPNMQISQNGDVSSHRAAS